MILIRDDRGQIFNKVKSPAIIVDTVDKDNCYIRKIGEKEKIEKQFEEMIEKYKKADLKEEVEKTILLVLPKNQKLVDKVYNYPGFLNKIIAELNKKGVEVND